MKKIVFASILSCCSFTAVADTWTSWSRPYQIKYSTDSILVYNKSYGDPINCGSKGYVSVSKAHPFYNEIKNHLENSLIKANRLAVRFYIESCSQVNTVENKSIRTSSINENSGGFEVRATP